MRPDFNAGILDTEPVFSGIANVNENKEVCAIISRVYAMIAPVPNASKNSVNLWQVVTFPDRHNLLSEIIGKN